ncbi:MAG: hypothetical protein ABIK25_07250 [Pseudomonadota bacterium]
MLHISSNQKGFVQSYMVVAIATVGAIVAVLAGVLNFEPSEATQNLEAKAFAQQVVAASLFLENSPATGVAGTGATRSADEQRRCFRSSWTSASGSVFCLKDISNYKWKAQMVYYPAAMNASVLLKADVPQSLCDKFNGLYTTDIGDARIETSAMGNAYLTNPPSMLAACLPNKTYTGLITGYSIVWLAVSASLMSVAMRPNQ